MAKQQPLNLDREGILLWTRNKDSHSGGFAAVGKPGKTAVVSKLQH